MENNTQSEDMILNEVILKIAHEELDKLGVPEEHSGLFVALFAGGYIKALKDLAEGIDIFKEVEEKLGKK
jgi:hypothetical protein